VPTSVVFLLILYSSNLFFKITSIIYNLYFGSWSSPL